MKTLLGSLALMLAALPGAAVAQSKKHSVGSLTPKVAAKVPTTPAVKTTGTSTGVVKKTTFTTKTSKKLLAGKLGTKKWTPTALTSFRKKLTTMSLAQAKQNSWRRNLPQSLRAAMLKKTLGRDFRSFRFRFFSPLYQTFLFFDPVTQTWYYFSPLLGRWVPISFLGVAPPPPGGSVPPAAGTPPAPPAGQTPQVPKQQPAAQEPPANTGAGATDDPGASDAGGAAGEAAVASKKKAKAADDTK
jgi:hypothetical protein